MHARTLAGSISLILFLSSCATVTPPPVSPSALTSSGARPAVAAVEEVGTDIDQSTVICRYELITGSRIAKRTCRTRVQVAVEQAEAANTVDKLSVRGPIGGTFKRAAH